MRRRFTLTLLIAGLLSVVAPAPRVCAQLAEIPKEVVRKPVLGPEDDQVVKKFVTDRLPLLSNADPAVMKKSRDELLSAFKDAQVSVSFRQSFNTAAIAELRNLAGNAQDVVVVNALRVSAEMATSDGTALLESKLADPRVAVKFAAVNGLDRTMAALAAKSPAIPQQRVEQLVDVLAKVVVDPKNTPEVIDAAVRALMQARNVSLGNVKSMAFQSLTTSVGKVAQRMGGSATPEALQRVFLRAGETARDFGNAQAGLGADGAKDAAWLGGQLLSWSYCQLKAGTMPSEQSRAVASNVVKVAEATIVLAGTKSGVTIEPQKLGADFEKAGDKTDANFIRNITKVLQPLFGSPFNHPQNDFLNCK